MLAAVQCASCRSETGRTAATGAAPAVSATVVSAESDAGSDNGIDIARLVQMTIDAPALQAYFHEKEIPGRSPLVVVLRHPPKAPLRLSKFGQAVVVKTRDQVQPGEAVLEIEGITFGPSSASVEFSYLVEGIAGSASYDKGEGATWLLRGVTLAER